MANATYELTQYFSEMHRIPLLERTREKEFGDRIGEGDLKARSGLIEANLRLVVHIGKRYQSRGLPLSDLIEEGNIGLIEAADRFNPAKGCRFSTYAGIWIRHSILSAIRTKSRMVRLPAQREAILRRALDHQAERLSAGKSSSSEDLAVHVGVSKHEIVELMAVANEPISLDAPAAPNENFSLEQRLADDRVASPEAVAIDNSLREFLRVVLESLSVRERDLLKSRFGLMRRSASSYVEIAQRHGITGARVRQLEAATLKKLRLLYGERLKQFLPRVDID